MAIMARVSRFLLKTNSEPAKNGGPRGDFSIGHSNLPGFSTCHYDPRWGRIFVMSPMLPGCINLHPILGLAASLSSSNAKSKRRDPSKPPKLTHPKYLVWVDSGQPPTATKYWLISIHGAIYA